MNFCSSPLNQNQNTSQHGEIQVAPEEIVAFVAHLVVPANTHTNLSASVGKALDDLAGKGNLRSPQVRTLDKWADIGGLLGNIKPKIVQIFTHGRAAVRPPLGQVEAKLLINENENDFVDGTAFVNMLQNYECVLVTACHSNDMIVDLDQEKASKIKNLIVCEGQLSDNEATQVAVAFYGALLYKKLTIASAARVAAEFLDQAIVKSQRSVKLHFYQNGIEIPIDKIVFEKALSK